MASIEITTNIGCRNSCVYCPQDKFVGNYKKRSNIFLMSFDVFKICLDKTPLPIEVIFSGMSEPYTNKSCTEMIRYAYQRKRQVSLFTTLVGMEIEDIKELEKISFKYFWVHLPSDGAYEKIKVNDKYLEILKRLKRSPIKAYYHFRGKKIHPGLEGICRQETSQRWFGTRAGNIAIEECSLPKRKKGVIGCSRRLRDNVLLPNGDILLCCIDYGLKHILGNLLKEDYENLFKNEEFKKVENGLKNESANILCRYCDQFAYNISLFAKIHNSLTDIHDKESFYRFLKKISKKLE